MKAYNLDLCVFLGLDYITEFQKENIQVEPMYICDLCEVKMDIRQLIAHTTGYKHRMKYFVSVIARFSRTRILFK